MAFPATALRDRLRAVPEAPGVYLFRDRAGRVIYVGKALRLRDRLRSYFQESPPANPRLDDLRRAIFEFEIVRCANEAEALVLECNLIKHHRPRFNVKLRDDKNYLYLKIPVADRFPRVHYTRRVVSDGALYFGPYTSAQSLRSTVKSLRQLFPFRTCSDDIFGQGQVCLDFHIRRCPGPCEGRISPEEYARRIQQVATFMEGRSSRLVTELEQEMFAAAERLEFERAARIRDRLRAMERIAERQKVIARTRDDEDIVAYAGEGAQVYFEVACVREGKMVGHDGHGVEGAGGVEEPELLQSFLVQYYASATHIPRRVLLPGPISEPGLVQEWLSSRRGGRVELLVPRRGKKRELVVQAGQTALEMLRQQRIAADYDRNRTEPMLAELAAALEMEAPPRRIECYDISNLQGDSATGSMVVFVEGRPETSAYRHFKIRHTPGPNDFAMHQEVLRRRFGRLELEQRRSADAEAGGAASDSFSRLPDLIIIDGGKGQLSAALEVLEEAGYADIPIVGLAKQFEEIFVPGRSDPILLDRRSPALFLLQRIRDEAHRFALTLHRKVRARKTLSSPLDSVEGVGPARKRRLLRTFGSLQAIREAEVGEIVALGIPEPVALRVKELV